MKMSVKVLFMSLMTMSSFVKAFTGAVNKACYERVYSELNLSENPGQFVKEIQFKLSQSEGSPVSYAGLLSVKSVGINPQSFDNKGVCTRVVSDSVPVYECGSAGESGKYRVTFLARTKIVQVEVKTPLILSASGPREAQAGTVTLEPGKQNGYHKLLRLAPQFCL